MSSTATAIVQTVDHRDHAYSYPIIADPHWAESISRCYTPSWTNNTIQKLNTALLSEA
jgi:hypothetical protein